MQPHKHENHGPAEGTRSALIHAEEGAEVNTGTRSKEAARSETRSFADSMERLRFETAAPARSNSQLSSELRSLWRRAREGATLAAAMCVKGQTDEDCMSAFKSTLCAFYGRLVKEMSSGDLPHLSVARGVTEDPFATSVARGVTKDPTARNVAREVTQFPLSPESLNHQIRSICEANINTVIQMLSVFDSVDHQLACLDHLETVASGTRARRNAEEYSPYFEA